MSNTAPPNSSPASDNESPYDASDITPGFALFAAERLRNAEIEELRSLTESISAIDFVASSIQLVLMITDWVALSDVNDRVAKAYSEDDREQLDSFAAQGLEFTINEDGTLTSWINPDAVSSPMDFPLEFWTDFKFGVQSGAQLFADSSGLPEDAVNQITAGIINDGIVPLLTGETDVEIPRSGRFFTNEDEGNFALIACSAFITSTIVNNAAEYRNTILKVAVEDGFLEEFDALTYDDVNELIRESLNLEITGG